MGVAMTDLQIRRVPFRFDESTPYQWLPANPDFGHLLNGISVIAVAFETYIVSVVRQAFDLIPDAEVAEEADAFLRQEAQHARAHRLHLRALAAQHPGVKGVLDDAVAAYDALLDAEPLEFHLAYIADLEATFTPLFTMMLNNRATLFEPGDDRVASLFLWHFVEEVEHRSSALRIYDAVVGKPWYRLRVMPRVFGHAEGVFTGIMQGFDAHVPPADLVVSTRRVLSTAMSFLGLYRDPTVAAVTSRCDWRIADLIASASPVSLYLVVPPSDISRTKPLIRLILNQIGRRLTESLDGSDGIERRHKLLLMLDEFPALGRLDFFETSLAFLAEGAKVAVLDIEPPDFPFQGNDLLYVKTDVSQSGQVNAAFDKLLKTFGGVDVLVNNAAILAQATIEETTLEVWEQGRFIRFHGLSQWLGWLWPFAAILFGLRTLARPPRISEVAP